MSESNSSGYDFDNVSSRVQSSFVLSGPIFVILMVMMVTLVVVIVLGNALVILAFKVDKSLRRQCNYYFLNLAISDFLVGAFCIPVYIPYILTGRWTLGQRLCKLWLVIDYLLCSASVFNIVLISYDRFLSVTRAVSYRARQSMTHQAIIKMIAVWVLAFALYGPAIIFWELVVGRSRVPKDECRWPHIPLDVLINLYSFLQLKCLRIKFTFIIKLFSLLLPYCLFMNFHLNMLFIFAPGPWN
uniref:Muscarinic acetylcholine receptor n=1 Tax=Anabas testudineus TaxID=64144 RepID=A0A7N6ARK9_ANATE